MTNKKTIKTIQDAYSSLRVLNNIDWKSYREDIYNLEKQYEKNHRNYCNGREFNITVDMSAKLFVVQHIASALKGTRHEVKSYIHLKQSIFLAESLVINYEDKIKEALKDFDLNQLCNLDYSILMLEKKVA
jgi:hypothetical protein|tara:strand:+ start:214 stop:606 length:393 start_codon:yes stop_codon:yes gene_type:complete